VAVHTSVACSRSIVLSIIHLCYLKNRDICGPAAQPWREHLWREHEALVMRLPVAAVVTGTEMQRGTDEQINQSLVCLSSAPLLQPGMRLQEWHNVHILEGHTCQVSACYMWALMPRKYS
jgi:hypothetical protein